MSEKDVRKELRNCRRNLKKARNLNQRFRLLIGETVVDSIMERGWQAKADVVRLYGWVYAWLYPLSAFMNTHLGEPLTPELRNKIHDLVSAIIGLIAVEGKYGVKLPLDPRPHDLGYELYRQAKGKLTEYIPCVICGEDRITYDCHIIPRADGGSFDRDNLITLCPLHHHLFDHHRLSEEEWKKLSVEIDKKMEGAAIYTRQIRLPALQYYWKEREE